MDKSLDEIISTRPKRRSGPRRGGRSQILGNASAPPSQAARVAVKQSQAPQPADKIIVSNLPYDVNEQQIKELFHTTVGALREVTLHFDANGRSKGVASIQFQRKGDGTKAYQQYNNRLIDGKRPMKIEIVVDPTKIPSTSLASRVAPAAGENQSFRTGRPRRGRGGGGEGKRRADPPQKSLETLDAEMEDYTASRAAPGADV